VQTSRSFRVCLHQFRGDDSDHGLVQVPWVARFPHVPADDDAELFEFAAKIDDKGTMMSVLWVPSRS
jgi:hypothetical protein